MLDISAFLEVLVVFIGGVLWLFIGFARSTPEPGHKNRIIIRLAVLFIVMFFVCVVLYVLSNPEAVLDWYFKDAQLGIY